MISFVWAVVTGSEEVPPYRDEVSARACCWLLDATLYCKNLCRLVTSCLCHVLATISPMIIGGSNYPSASINFRCKWAVCPCDVGFCANTEATEAEVDWLYHSVVGSHA